MQRVKIQLPQKFDFSCKIPIRITDLNYGGHVGNDAILSLLHEARLQYLNHFQFSELDFGGVSLIMADVAIQFKNELFYGDTIIASVAAVEFSKVAFEIYYKLEKQNGDKRLMIAAAKTGMVCYDYINKKIAQVPQEVKERLSA